MTRKTQTASDLSPVFARGVSARPQVQAPDSPWTMWVGLAGATVLGVMVFNGLSSGREARAQTTAQPPVAQKTAPPVPPPPAAPPPAQPVAAPPTYIQQPVAPPVDPEQAHWRAPTVVVDFGANGAAAEGTQLAQATTTVVAPGATVVPGGEGRQSADERFSAGVTRGLGDTARAGQMRDLGRVVPQGTVIAATLETAINSDLPGAVRAVVSRDVRSFDGSRVLIPRGSRLVGQYKSAAAIGQTRAFVVWSRIITPAGVSVEVGSPATDRLGRGGLNGEVDTHFVRRFGSSILLTVISAGGQALANSATNGDNTTLVIGGAGGQASNPAAIALQKQMDMPDTIKVAQGVPVQVSVARDLDFSSVVR